MSSHILHGEKYVWRLPTFERQIIADIAASYNLSFPIAQTLVARGFTSPEAIDAFLFSSFERDVAHASLLKDVQRSVDRIFAAIKKQESILVFWRL